VIHLGLVAIHNLHNGKVGTRTRYARCKAIGISHINWQRSQDNPKADCISSIYNPEKLLTSDGRTNTPRSGPALTGILELINGVNLRCTSMYVVDATIVNVEQDYKETGGLKIVSHDRNPCLSPRNRGADMHTLMFASEVSPWS
jgi:hypothetical protein